MEKEKVWVLWIVVRAREVRKEQRAKEKGTRVCGITTLWGVDIKVFVTNAIKWGIRQMNALQEGMRWHRGR